eukprot:1099845-Prymnesium_polylepis.1
MLHAIPEYRVGRILRKDLTLLEDEVTDESMAASRMSRKRHGHEPQRASRESARTQPTHRAGRARARRRASLSGRPENLRAAALRGARLARGGAQLGGALGAGRSDELTEERAAVVEQLRGGAVLAQVAGVHDGDGV